MEREPSFDDLTLIMRVLMDIRADVERIRTILEEAMSKRKKTAEEKAYTARLMRRLEQRIREREEESRARREAQERRSSS